MVEESGFRSVQVGQDHSSSMVRSMTSALEMGLIWGWGWGLDAVSLRSVGCALMFVSFGRTVELSLAAESGFGIGFAGLEA